MDIRTMIPGLREGASGVLRGRIEAILDDGGVEVVAEDGGVRAACDVLESAVSDRRPLSVSDPVLVWMASGSERGVVLGRIAAAAAVSDPPSASGSGAETEDELVLEARKSLTLRCGDGSITIREDGRILIKGKDLVSHARRLNRIKGGSVSIN